MARRNTLEQRDLILKVCRPGPRFSKSIAGPEPAGIKGTTSDIHVVERPKHYRHWCKDWLQHHHTAFVHIWLVYDNKLLAHFLMEQIKKKIDQTCHIAHTWRLTFKLWIAIQLAPEACGTPCTAPLDRGTWCRNDSHSIVDKIRLTGIGISRHTYPIPDDRHISRVILQAYLNNISPRIELSSGEATSVTRIAHQWSHWCPWLNCASIQGTNSVGRLGENNRYVSTSCGVSRQYHLWGISNELQLCVCEEQWKLGITSKHYK